MSRTVTGYPDGRPQYCDDGPARGRVADETPLGYHREPRCVDEVECAERIATPRIPYRDDWATGRESRYRQLDPDPLHVEPDEPRLPYHGWTPPKRRGCSVLARLALILAIAPLAAPGGLPDHGSTRPVVGQATRGAPHGTSQVLPRSTVALDAAVAGPGGEVRSPARGAPLPVAPFGASYEPMTLVVPLSTMPAEPAGNGVGVRSGGSASVPAPSGGLGTALMAGNISWADPELGGDYLATRFPRGTLVRLCSERPVCILRTSNDFGPSEAIDPPRIADLAVLDWEQLCGLPRARGLCFGTIEAIENIPLPATDTGGIR